MKVVCISLLFLFSFVTLGGQNAQNVMFEHLTIKEQLSHYSVMGLYQDERGLIWIGTRNGVNVYDGNEVHVYKQDWDTDGHVVSNSIRDITGDKNGKIYFLTIRGISCFDIKKETFTTLTQNNVAAMYYDKQLYIGMGNKVYAHDGRQFVPCYELPETEAKIFSLTVSGDSLLMGTEEQGLYIYSRKEGRLTHPIKTGQVNDIFKDSKHRYWVGTLEDGLYVITSEGLKNYRRNAADSHTLCSDFIRKCREDHQGNIWIGTFRGLSRYSERDDAFVNYLSEGEKNGQSHVSVWSLLCDSQGMMWVGSYFGGVSYFNPKLDFYKRYTVADREEDGLSFPVVGEMTEDAEHNLWICTEGGGLNMLDRKTGKFKWFRHTSSANSISHDNVKSICYDHKRGVMWVGTHLGGLNKLDLRTGKFTRYICGERGKVSDKANTVCDILLREESLLLATHDGVYRFDIERETFHPLFKSGKEGAIIHLALDLKIDHRGVLWIAGVEKGVYSYDFDTGMLTPHPYSRTVEGSLSSNGVNCIYTGSDNRLWFCMAESGLDLYNYDTGTFRNFDEEHNRLQNDCVYGACELSADKLLVITDKGFSCLDSVTGYFRNFDVKSGLPLSAINQNAVYKASDGEIFIGGIDGMVSFQSDDLDMEPYSYSIFPYKLFINDKEVKVGDETGVLQQTLSESPRITLKASQSMFSLVYALTDYASLSRSYMMYKLENFQNEWVTMRGGCVITYTNLNPGKYTLLVKNDSRSGAEENISRLEIEILPPFYKTIWAILLYVLSGVAILSYIVRTYKKRISLQAELKYERKHIKDVELLNQHKLRFFINISHEFRTPLTLIIGQMEMLLQVPNFAPLIYNKILRVYKNGLQLRELITELLDFRKQEQGHMKIKVRQQNIVDFLYENYLLFCEYALRRKIEFKFHKTCDTILVWYDAKQFQKVVNNMLSNAFKYTADGGEVALSVRKGKGTVIVEVTDNGCGIEEKDQQRIFDRFYQSDRTLSSTGTGIGVGLALSKGIVELHHGSIEVFSTVNEGTTFVISLPLGCEHFVEGEIVNEECQDFVPVEQKRMKYEAMEEVAAVEEDGQEHKVLIVEDETDLRNMLVDIFRPYYTIITAENGEKALEAIEKEMPDLVLTDVLMPGISGIELCKKIKENVDTCHIPVMLLTARTAIEHKLEGLQTGADDYITKPFDVNILLSRCKNLINNRMMLQEKYGKQPQKTSQILATTPADKEFMDRAMKVIEEHLDDSEFNMNVFAREMGIARTKLFSKLKAIANQTPNDLVLSVRMKKAASMLRDNPELNITEISDRLGFCSSRYFSRCFKEKYNLTPQAYRRGEKPVVHVEN